MAKSDRKNSALVPNVGFNNAPGNNKYFDPKMGSIVFYINSEYGADLALIAATKQAAYTFLVGGSMMRLTENLVTYFRSDRVSRITSVTIPSILTIGLTYLIHSIKGTPEPFESTIPTIILEHPPHFFGGAIKYLTN